MDRDGGMHHGPPRKVPDYDGHRKMPPGEQAPMDRGDKPDMRDRGMGKPFERENERKEGRMGRSEQQPERGEDAKNHKIVQKSRGGRGGGPNNN